MKKNRGFKKRKVHLHVLVDEDLYDRVRRLAVHVYDYHRGALSYAVQEGLELWLATHASAHKVNPKVPVRERYNAVMDCVDLELGVVPITLQQPILEKCIMNALEVGDYRSVYGWLHRFYAAGLIKPLTISVGKPADWRRNRAVEIVAKRV